MWRRLIPLLAMLLLMAGCQWQRGPTQLAAPSLPVADSGAWLDANGQPWVEPQALAANTAGVEATIPVANAVNGGLPVQPVALVEPVDAQANPALNQPQSLLPVPLPEPEPTAAGVWTQEDLVQIALQHNPTLVQAAAAVQAAEGQYVQRGLYPNPTVGYAGGDIGIEDTSGQQGILLGQEVVTKGKLQLARNVASYEIEQARYAWDAQRQRVLNDVRSGYYEVLLAQRTIDVSERLVDISQQVVDVNEKLYRQLEINKPVLLQSRIEANTARLRLVEARKSHEAAWRRLAALIGQPELPAQSLAGDPTQNLPQFTWDGVVQHLLSQSPEVARACLGVERARCELARQCAQKWPNFQVGSWIKYDEPTRDTLLDVEMSFPLPVYNRNQGGIMDAQAALISAEREVDRVQLNLTHRVADAFQRYSVAQQQVQLYRESILPDAQESLDLANVGYRAGEFTYLDLLVAQSTYFDASLKSLQQLKELWASSIQLDGLMLSGGLNTP